jgi:hypothetical protein
MWARSRWSLLKRAIARYTGQVNTFNILRQMNEKTMFAVKFHGILRKLCRALKVWRPRQWIQTATKG